ncbi:DUF805 domain-containing protein [Aliarcobacter cibarius]|nr:DUF805 domain-containing protein [Aliarcobacter cibarius]
MFGVKYSRLTFWIWSICLLMIDMILVIVARLLEAAEIYDKALFLYVFVFFIGIIWINVLANRIRDYGSNPWISAFAMIPLANIGLALYYGIVNKKSKPKLENVSNSYDSTSLSKAVYNHSKDILSEIKPTIDEYKQNHSTSKIETQTSSNLNSEINEDEIYEQIMLEIEEDRKIKGIWAKALAQSDGNKDKAESIYIKIRLEQEKTKSLKNIENLKQNKIIENNFSQSNCNFTESKKYKGLIEEVGISTFLAPFLIIFITIVIIYIAEELLHISDDGLVFISICSFLIVMFIYMEITKSNKKVNEIDLKNEGIAIYNSNLDNDFSIYDELDELYEEAKVIVLSDKKTSISHIQKKLKIGNFRALTIMEQLEKTGVLSEADEKGNRTILL